MTKRHEAEDVAAAIPDRRVARIETIDDAARLAAMLASVFKFGNEDAFLMARSFWDRRKKMHRAA